MREAAPDAFEMFACMPHADRPAAVLRSQFGGDAGSAAGALEPADLAERLGIAPAYGAEDAPESLAEPLSSACTANAQMSHLTGGLPSRGPAHRPFAARLSCRCAGGPPSHRRLPLDEMLRPCA